MTNYQKGMVSFCCVCYNHAQFIEDCIKSIQNQDYKNIEILILDDGSKDNSVEVINKLKETSSCPMRVITQENCGNVGANFNKLINDAQGEYVSIISCDDMWIENSLSKRMQALLDDPNLAFTCNSRFAEVDENNNKTSTCPPIALDSLANPTAERILELEYSTLGAYYIQGGIYKTEIVKAVGGFDEDMICDDIILRTKIARYITEHEELKFKVFYEPSIYYRRHSNNLSDNTVRQIKSVLQYLSRYWSDREPPKIIYDWITYGLWTNFDDTRNIFFPNDYIAKIVSNMDRNIFVKNDDGVLYKTQGVKYLFEILSYRTKEQKTKIIKLFGKIIIKKKKFVNN